MGTYPCVFIVDDDPAVRDALGLLIEAAGLAYQTFESAEHFLLSYWPGKHGCLLLDINMPGMSGFDLQRELIRRLINLPIIFLTAHSDALMKDRAIKSGAVDFFSKPIPIKLLIERIQTVLQHEAFKTVK
jgi:FixJ family two-component response regulator